MINRKESLKKYTSSEKFKITNAKYVNSEKGKLTHKRCKYNKKKENERLISEYLGGLQCASCGITHDSLSFFDFHHKDPTTKSFNITNRIGGSSFILLKDEIDKCDLLCCTCHNITHKVNFNKLNTESPSYKRLSSNIIRLKKYYNIDIILCHDCKRCLEYDRYHIIEWHHVDPLKKEVHVSSLLGKTTNLLKIINEADKCIPLCPNCHRLRHIGEHGE